MPHTASTKEHRTAPRRRVLLSGKLVFGEGLSLDCPIREESDTGARIVVGEHLVPREVVLISVTRGIAYDAEVIWRRGKEAGLHFLHAYPLQDGAGDAPPSIRLARRLWAENAPR